MTKEYFRIKDNCRKGLLKYLSKAFSLIPKIESPKILDIGCGTGVPTLWLAENFNGTITAIDTDKKSLNWLLEKIKDKNFNNQITILNISFFNLKTNPDYFDFILAEGFLNVVGFERGFLKIKEMLGNERYLVIHDEYKDHEKKFDFISNNHCKVINTLFLDENVWWDDYYRQLETEINAMQNKQNKDLFKSDLKEIESYKVDPSVFRSLYYIVRKF